MWPLVVLCLLSAGPDVQVSTLAGAREGGELVRLTSDEVAIRNDNREQVFPAAQLLSLIPSQVATASNERPTSVWLELVDGSRLLATSYTTTGGTAKVNLRGGASIDVPTRSIRSVRLQDHDSELARTSNLSRQWSEILATAAAGDQIVVRKLAGAEDSDAPPTSASLDQLEGVLGDVGDEKVQFTYEEQQIPVARTKVEGIVYFHPAGRELPDPLCIVHTVAGSTWHVKSLSLADEQLQWVSVSGVRGELPLSQVRQLDYSAGKIVYLSDLEPETIKWTNFYGDSPASAGLAKMFAPRRDRSFDGGKIVIDGKAFDKGLAVHSRTLLEYRLQGKFNKFIALAGLDEKVRHSGDVKLVISLDGKLLGEYQLTGQSSAPTAIELDVRQGRKLSILVDFGAGLDISDRLHLANARVTK